MNKDQLLEAISAKTGSSKKEAGSLKKIIEKSFAMFEDNELEFHLYSNMFTI